MYRWSGDLDLVSTGGTERYLTIHAKGLSMVPNLTKPSKSIISVHSLNMCARCSDEYQYSDTRAFGYVVNAVCTCALIAIRRAIPHGYRETTCALLEGKISVMTYDHHPMRITQNYLCTHIYQVIDKERRLNIF